MGIFSTVLVCCIALVGTAVLCRRAGNTRKRSESIVATETYKIRERDSYTIEYRHCITTGIYNIFAVAYPSNGLTETDGLTPSGQLLTSAEPRTLDQATKIAREWMTDHSESLHADDGNKTDLSRPAVLRRSTSRQTRPLWKSAPTRHTAAD